MTLKVLKNTSALIKVKILPPRKLYHPVLPFRIKGKLVFPLCRSCAENERQESCKCSDEDRCLIASWCTPELIKAVECGYVILNIYEVYHWDETLNLIVKRENQACLPST